MSAQLESLLQRLEAVTSRLEKVNVGGKPSSDAGASAAGDAVDPSVTAFDEYVQQFVAPFLATNKSIGGDLTELATLVEKNFVELRRILEVASKSKKPSDSEFGNFIKPINAAMNAIDDARAKKRTSDFADHYASVSEGIKCVAWIAMPTPVSYVSEMVNAASFYSNKVLGKFRKTDERHLAWVNEFKTLIQELAKYVKEYHTAALKWNNNGKPFAEASKAGSSAAPAAPAAPTPAAGGAPPPPPPGPAPMIDAAALAKANAASSGSMSDVLNQIQSGNLTSGLKKVTSDMKTKNRPANERSSVVPATSKSTAATAGSKFEGGNEKMGTPRVELVEGKKWVIEYQQGVKDIVIDQTELKHTVYMYKCIDTLVTIKGKVNAITMDGCRKSGLIFENAVSSVETVNCKSVQVQCTGSVPTIIVDKTDGVQLYISEGSYNATIVSSKSSEMNLVVPTPDGDDTEEIPMPEQFTTTYDPKKRQVHTVPNSHV